VKRSTVPIDSIKPHPRNYRGHPSTQVDAIRHSLDQFGQYRDVVVSSDGCIIAGHGVWLWQKAEGA
jgi:23S rRNA maturation-related 3'-5' exoribonuclease YhaM